MKLSHITPIAAGTLAVLTATAANAQVFLRSLPVFSPTGSSTLPHSNVAAGAWAAGQAGGDLRINAGTMHQTITLNQPLTLTANDGPATISANASASTNLRVGSYNVRLWPGFFVSLLFADHERADLIGPRLDAENCDVIGLQEVWDYALDIPDASEFISSVSTGYPFAYYGGEFNGNFNSSGLLTMSPHLLWGGAQFTFGECDGNDCSANKGWTRTSFVKDGFTVTVFNTHTQAGNSAENRNTRLAQLNQMAVDILLFRSFNPTHAIFVVGDFNIDGFGSEFSGNMNSVMGGVAQLAHGARNFPGSPDANDCTACSFNTIKQIFGNDGTNTQLDHILYINSGDGQVKIIPTAYEVKQYRRTDGGQWCRNVVPTGCGNDLSDHEAVFMNFNLRRVTP